jgi:hypothetical protein
LVDSGDQAFGHLDTVCSTVAEGPEVGERGLGVSTRVGQAASVAQRYGDVSSRLAGAEDIPGLFTVADILLVVVQRAVDEAGLAVDDAELVVSDPPIGHRGCRHQGARPLPSRAHS